MWCKEYHFNQIKQRNMSEQEIMFEKIATAIDWHKSMIDLLGIVNTHVKHLHGEKAAQLTIDKYNEFLTKAKPL